jgi:hypothetical protein
MSKRIIATIGAAAFLALSTATFTGTALADSASAVGCSASDSQNGDLIPVNAVLGNAVNGNNVLSNCPANASAK